MVSIIVIFIITVYQYIAQLYTQALQLHQAYLDLCDNQWQQSDCKYILCHCETTSMDTLMTVDYVILQRAAVHAAIRLSAIGFHCVLC